MKTPLHSVNLVEDLCIGCTDCIKRCPTEAIRVRNGKAVIEDALCIDCGMCIRVCRNKAKQPVIDKIQAIQEYVYPVAIPAPALYSQFKKINDLNILLTAVKRLGFRDVFEVSKAAEWVTEETRNYIISNKDVKKPVISSACPVIIRLIQMRFPSLIENILPMLSPMEIAAIAVKNHLVAEGVAREAIGVFFVGPCAAKKTNTLHPLGIETSAVDGVVSIAEVYGTMRSIIRNLKKEEVEILTQTTEKGVDWALSGGESKGIPMENTIAVDGIENVIKVLEEVENGQLLDVDFIEASACIGGCVGGPLTLENSFVAENTLRKIQKHAFMMDQQCKRPCNLSKEDAQFYFTKPIEGMTTLELDSDRTNAIEKLEHINEILETLPGIDCGSCGCPTCQTFAEDVVKGLLPLEECVVLLKEKLQEIEREQQQGEC